MPSLGHGEEEEEEEESIDPLPEKLKSSVVGIFDLFRELKKKNLLFDSGVIKSNQMYTTIQKFVGWQDFSA